MNKTLDCVVCGSCVADLLCRPVNLDRPLGRGTLHRVEPILLTAGGITSNAGITMARLGLRVGVLSYVGNDAWAPLIRNLFRGEGIDVSTLATHPTAATSTTVVAIDVANEESGPELAGAIGDENAAIGGSGGGGGGGGERSFLHCVGAPKLLDAKAILDRLDLLSRTRVFLLGYYSLLPNLEADLPRVLAAVRATGCQTALDAAGTGGTMQPLDRILPHLNIYVPSLNEARHQTGLDDPHRIVEVFRRCGAPGLLGVKLGGAHGVLLSPRAGEWVSVPSCVPPGPVVDTTGAGDCFYAGLVAGLVRGLPVEQAGRLGTAAAACCVTALGGSTGGRDWATTARIAGIA